MNHGDGGIGGTTAAPGIALGPRRQGRILLAEDDLEMRRLLAWSLERGGYQVSECADGITLLRRLGLMDPRRTKPDFDLVISDVRMPGYTGLQVLESIRACDNCPPVVLISAFADNATREKANRLGAADLLPKPFDVDELLAAVRRLLPLAARRAEPEPPQPSRLRFPLEVTVRHGSVGAPVERFIARQARRFEQLGDEVRGCRVEIDTADPDEAVPHHTGVKLVVTTRGGRPLVVGYDAAPGDDTEGLFITLQTVFATAWRHLKERHARRRPRASGGEEGEH